MRKLLFAMLLPAMTPVVANADDLDAIDTLSQAQFRLLAEDLGAVLAYRGLQPAEPYGVVGFDFGVEGSAVRVANDAAWSQAGADVSTVVLTRVSANKGLPLGFDVGGFLAAAPGTGMRLFGAQLRYAFIEGGVATPAFGMRAAVTRLEGVDQLDYTTRSLDLSISKGFGPVTPYAGFGRVWGEAAADAGISLQDEDVAMNRAFAGVRFSLVALQFVLEAERTGEATGFAAKVGFGF